MRAQRNLKSAFAMPIHLHCHAKQVADCDVHIRGHFLAEGFCVIFQINEQLFVHWDSGAWRNTPANLVHSCGKIGKSLVHVDSFGKTLDIGGTSRMRHRWRGWWGRHVIRRWSPWYTGTREVILHPICLDKSTNMFLWARRQLRPVRTWAWARRRWWCSFRFQFNCGSCDCESCCWCGLGQTVTGGQFGRWSWRSWCKHLGIHGLGVHEIIRVRLAELHLLSRESHPTGYDVLSWLPKHQLGHLRDGLLVGLRWRTLPATGPAQTPPDPRSMHNPVQREFPPSSTRLSGHGSPRNWRSANCPWTPCRQHIPSPGAMGTVDRSCVAGVWSSPWTSAPMPWRTHRRWGGCCNQPTRAWWWHRPFGGPIP